MINFYLVLIVYFLFTISIKLSRVLRALKRIGKPSTASRVEFYTALDGIKRKVFFMNVKVTQSLPLMIQPVDKFGNPAQVDGVPAWSLTDPSKGSIAPSDDGMSATFTPSGPLGEVMVQVSADADLGEGVKSILGELPISILAGEAVSVSISAGTPSDI